MSLRRPRPAPSLQAPAAEPPARDVASAVPEWICWNINDPLTVIGRGGTKCPDLADKMSGQSASGSQTVKVAPSPSRLATEMLPP